MQVSENVEDSNEDVRRLDEDRREAKRARIASTKDIDNGTSPNTGAVGRSKLAESTSMSPERGMNSAMFSHAALH